MKSVILGNQIIANEGRKTVITGGMENITNTTAH